MLLQGKMLETFLEKHSKKSMKEDKQGKGRMQWTNGRVKEKHKRACEKIMLKMGIKVGIVSLNYITELPLLELWTFLNNDKGHICKKLMDKLKVVINRTYTCYISKNQNCFVSWKIFKNAYSNFDDRVFAQKEPYCNQYLNSSTFEKFLHFRQEKKE